MRIEDFGGHGVGFGFFCTVWTPGQSAAHEAASQQVETHDAAVGTAPWGLGFGVGCLVFRVQGLEFRVEGVGFGVEG